MKTANLQDLPGSPGCFICDNNGSNARSLHLQLRYDADEQAVYIPCDPDESWCGFSGVVHGGLVATVMDEAMAWAVKQRCGEWAFTAECVIRYKKPVQPGCGYYAKARVVAAERRKISVEAGFYDGEGAELARASATFLPSKGKANPRTA
ncbi:PaaI family thioesterase [Desulfovibrio sp. OttesenSCG-928-G15]|nr:PaaI family thioesterase [Desulfovibrio sp. OttesenSCG-928-G15]